MTSLTDKVVKGGMWIFAIKIVASVLNLLKTIILARLLVPEDFGLMGVALLAVSLFDTFSKTGIGPALVQKKNNIEDYLDSAWVINIFRGIIIFLLLFIGAPLVASFFNNLQVIPIIKTFAFSPLVLAFMSPKIVYFQKNFQFNKQFIFEMAATIVDISASIILAFILRNVWALVWGILLGNITRLIFSYIVFPYKPKFQLDIHKTKELLNFGKWIFGTSIVTFLFNQGDDAFLGKILGLTALGFYQIAYRLGQLPATEFAKVISTVTFPAYSKAQDDISKLKAGFLKTLNITVIFMIPFAGIIFVLAPDFTQIFLTQQWLPIVSPLRILVVAGMVRALVTTGGALFHGKGVPKIDFKMNFIRLSILVVTIYPLTLEFGISGTAFAVALGNFGCVPVWMTETAKITKLSFNEYFKTLFYPFLGTTVMCLMISFIRSTIEINILSFVFLNIFAIGIYVIIMYFLARSFNVEILRDLKFITRAVGGK